MIDYTKNQNPTSIYKVLEVLDENLPNYMQGAEIPESDYVTTLNKQAFADQNNKLFPCYDQVSTWLSACDIYGQNVTDMTVLENLEKRASFLGIKDDVATIKVIFEPEVVKQASNKQDYALVIEENGQNVGYWPVTDVLELDDACSSWKEARALGKVPSDLLKQAAEVIVSAANNFDYTDSVPAIIKEAAAEKLPDFDKIPAFINFRVNSVEDEDSKQLYTKMASTLNENNTEEWIQTMDVLDYSLLTPDLRKHDMFKTAYEMVYSGMTTDELKQVAESNISLSIGDGNLLIPVSQFDSYPVSEIDKLYPESVSEILKQAKVASSASDKAVLLDSLTDEYKIEFLSNLKEHVK